MAEEQTSPSKEEPDLETIRLSWIWTQRKEIPRNDWWSAIAGDKPNTINENPREGIIQMVGPALGANLGLFISPKRIDWTLMPRDENLTPEGRTPTIGSLSEQLPKFQEAMMKWIAVPDQPNRIAVGLTLNFPSSDHIDAAKKLVQLLAATVKIDPANSSDFMYQVNRRRPSKVHPEIKINHLGKWMILNWASLVLPGNLSVPTFPLMAAARIEADVNTVPSEQPIERNSVKDLLQELLADAQELVENGDRL